MRINSEIRSGHSEIQLVVEEETDDIQLNLCAYRSQAVSPQNPVALGARRFFQTLKPHRKTCLLLWGHSIELFELRIVKTQNIMRCTLRWFLVRVRQVSSRRGKLQGGHVTLRFPSTCRQDSKRRQHKDNPIPQARRATDKAILAKQARMAFPRHHAPPPPQMQPFGGVLVILPAVVGERNRRQHGRKPPV